MKRINKALLASVTCAAVLGLAGCGGSKQIAEVKALAFSYPNSDLQDPNLTVDQALDTRKICDSVKWSLKRTDRHQAFVEYDCNYKGIADSGFIERDKSDVASAGDVYQWTYGPDGQPTLSAVAFIIRYNNGTSKDFKYDPSTIMRLAVANWVKNFDQVFSAFQNLPIPVKPASPFTSTTYGNTLSTLYPGKNARAAASEAYVWKGAPAGMITYGIDKLGYLPIEFNPEFFNLLFPVNPADVQIAIKVDSPSPNQSPAKPPQLSPDKLYCVNEQCYDSDRGLVGRAPPSILAQETSSIGSQEAPATTPPADTAVSADGEDDWPADSPCITKLRNAFVKDADAKGIDDSVSLDQTKEWASTCKALGQ